MIKVALLLCSAAVAQQNTVKTANLNSIINFYFVTRFYSLYDICMVDGTRYLNNSEWLPKRRSFITGLSLSNQMRRKSPCT